MYFEIECWAKNRVVACSLICRVDRVQLPNSIVFFASPSLGETRYFEGSTANCPHVNLADLMDAPINMEDTGSSIFINIDRKIYFFDVISYCVRLGL